MKLEKITDNFHKLTIEDLTVWFSYNTPIAFKKDCYILISENEFSKTTARHINEVKKQNEDAYLFTYDLQIPHKDFKEKLYEVVRRKV